VVDLPPGFQPAGRNPAPPPLDVVQDFVNTEIPVWAVDDLSTPDLLAAWLRSRRLLSEDAVIDAGGFVRMRELRRLLRELARRNTRGWPVDYGLEADFGNLTGEARLRFELDERGDVLLRPAGAGVSEAVAGILNRVFEAQAAGTWRRLKSCPGPHCGWLFYDASRNASSTWCSMSICGNRTKTAAYRRRRRADA
jgi:predicted RNA-binding Zn ribbon-like protein